MAWGPFLCSTVSLKRQSLPWGIYSLNRAEWLHGHQRHKMVKHIGWFVGLFFFCDTSSVVLWTWSRNFFLASEISFALNAAALLESQIFTETSSVDVALCIHIKVLRHSCLLHCRNKFSHCKLPYRDLYTFQLVKAYFFSVEALKKASLQPCYLFPGK